MKASQTARRRISVYSVALAIFLCLIPFVGKTQRSHKHPVSIYGEAATNLYLSSVLINLEYRFFTNKAQSIKANARIGFGDSAILLGPVGRGFLAATGLVTGKKNHHFEVSAGGYMARVIIDDGKGDAPLLLNENLFFLPVFDMGYRFERPESGLLFKAKAGVMGIGIGLGYTF